MADFMPEQNFQLAIAAIIVIAAIFVLTLTLVLLRRWIRRLMVVRSGVDREMMKREWVKIEELLVRGDETSLRLAVIDADKLLDRALKDMSMPGKTMAERLRYAQNKYFELKRIWWAHNYRNSLVHDHIRLKNKKARAAAKEFQRAMRVIGIL